MKKDDSTLLIVRKMLRTAIKDYYEEFGKGSSSYFERKSYRFSFSYQDSYGSTFSVKGPKNYRYDHRCLSTMTHHIYFTNRSDPIIMFKDLALFHGYSQKIEQNDLTSAAKSFSNWLREKTNDSTWLEKLKSNAERSLLTKNLKQPKVLKANNNVSAL